MDLDHIRAVCWDWNGTLLDDADICRQVMNVVLEEHALSPLPDGHAYRSVFHFPIRDFYREIADDLGAQFLHFDGGHQVWSGDTRRIAALGELMELLAPIADHRDPVDHASLIGRTADGSVA